MEWKPDKISKTEMERRQADYAKKAMDMAKRTKYIPETPIKTETPKKIQAFEEETQTQPELKPNAGMSIQITSEKPQTEKETPPVKEPLPMKKQPESKQPEKEALSEKEKPAPSETIIRHEKREKTVIEAELEIGLSGILTEQEIKHIQPRQEIPEKIMNYSNNDTETLFEECVCEKPQTGENINTEVDILEVKRKKDKCAPPNFTEYINRHNQQFEESSLSKIHGNGAENNCPHCRNSKKNRI